MASTPRDFTGFRRSEILLLYYLLTLRSVDVLILEDVIIV